jgi:formamidopyrimidine-DNA glycosylase
MPELPEVETVRRSIELHALGQRLVSIDIKRTDLRHPVPEKDIHKALITGAELVALERRGKVLIMRFKTPGKAEPCLLVHLGMSGRLTATPFNEGASPAFEKHEHVRLTMENTLLRFIDPRRFGSVELCLSSKLDRHPRVNKLGVEPLSEDFTGAILFAGSRKRGMKIRDFLLTGTVVAGVGNIYANEACFEAGIRPQRKAMELSKNDSERLCSSIKEVLAAAVEAGGSTLSDGGYVDGEGKPGWFQFSHWVYNKAGEPCKKCKSTIKKVKEAKRSAFYCPKCQR